MAEPLQTHYDLLQVERDATADHIRQAYRRLVHKYHPDKTPGDAGAVRAMAAINAAYQVLSDAQQRAAYDRQLARAQQPTRNERQPAPSRPSRLKALFNPTVHWPWYVLAASIALAVGIVAAGISAYLSAVPAQASTEHPEQVQSAPPAKPAAAPSAPRRRRASAAHAEH